ncbi:MAG: F0F1 ATP synthase subunit delta [gamma proteobacterium symbiont of Taylorina sp.]|nr:F0F1 ATP synthase subunit delta [gamma proteobacterium symbiont of Taylorina sp.]
MAEASTLARPYAQAIFNLASADDTLQQWSDTLAHLKEIAGNQSVQELISNPDIPREEIVSLFVDISKEAMDDKAVNFLKITAENGRLELIPEIADGFEIMLAEHEGSIEARVISAYAVNATQTKKIAAALKKKFGREVTIKTETDKSLLGGIIIRAGDVVIDGSVKTQLEKITHSLLS